MVDKNDVDDKDIELRSEEYQEVLNKISPGILRWGMTVLFVIFSFLIIGSYFFRYPDTILADITINTQEPPIRIVTRSSGRLNSLYVSNGMKVSSGTILGVIENSAKAEDVNLLKDKIKEWSLSNYSLNKGMDLFFKSQLDTINFELGDIQHPYSLFISSFTNYALHDEFSYYKEKMSAQEKQLKMYDVHLLLLNKKKELIEKEGGLQLSLFRRDSLLHEKGAIRTDVFEESSSAYLRSLQLIEDISLELSSQEIQIQQLKESISDLNILHMEEEKRLLVELKNSIEELNTEISLWEQKYVLISPIYGDIVFQKIWGLQQYLEQGECVFNVKPNNSSHPIAKAFLPQWGSGKVKVGQKVNIRLNNYPDQEFGFLTGLVKNISPLSIDDNTYVVDICLPDGLITNYGVELSSNRELNGEAEIILGNLRLIEKFIQPIKKIYKEQKDLGDNN